VVLLQTAANSSLQLRYRILSEVMSQKKRGEIILLLVGSDDGISLLEDSDY